MPTGGMRGERVLPVGKANGAHGCRPTPVVFLRAGIPRARSNRDRGEAEPMNRQLD